MKSPLRNNGEVRFVQSFELNDVKNRYKRQLQIDVSKFFSKKESLNLFECVGTGYRFFYPFDTAGDGKFYEQLQSFDWYYMPWKWEHSETLKIIHQNHKVLEVGSGNNEFVKKLSTDGISATGLELNEHSVLKGKKDGLDIRGESIEKHVLENKDKFDIVCSFQVLELSIFQMYIASCLLK